MKINYFNKKSFSKLDEEAFITKREAQFLRLFLSGLSNKEIADSLLIQVRSLELIRSGLYKKWNVSGSIALAIESIRMGYLDVLLEYQSKNGEIQIERLTNRESQILNGLCLGMKNNDIARSLGLSRRTVETHRSKLYKKWNIKHPVELVFAAILNGYLEIKKPVPRDLITNYSKNGIGKLHEVIRQF